MHKTLTLDSSWEHREGEYKLHESIAQRRSPKGFVNKSVSREQLRLLLEAARWSPSSRNEQPWHFILATRDIPTEFERMLGTLTESNKAWAYKAYALIAVVAKWNGSRGPNRFAVYDTGGAVANLTVQAVAFGLQVHQMGGFNVDLLREVYHVPADCEPIVVLAIGHPDDSLLDQRQRVRKELSDFVFRNEWGNPFTITQNK